MYKKLLITLILVFNVNMVFSQIQYATTLYPFREILREVVGNRGDVIALLPPGASPHTYQIKPSDMRKVESATALIVGGYNLDEWALKFQNQNKLKLIELIPEEELLYFTHSEEAEEHQSGQQTHRHESGVDPHFWTDPLAVKSLLPALAHRLGKIDPDGGPVYQENARKFALQLDRLFAEINQKTASVRGRNVMLSHPFFRYYLKRFQINLVAVTEISPGKESTPKELKAMIDQVRSENVRAIFCHVQLPDRSARLVGEAAGVKVVALDPIGGTQGRQTYKDMLLYNTHLLVEALR